MSRGWAVKFALDGCERGSGGTALYRLSNAGKPEASERRRVWHPVRGGGHGTPTPIVAAVAASRRGGAPCYSLPDILLPAIPSQHVGGQRRWSTSTSTAQTILLQWSLRHGEVWRSWRWESKRRGGSLKHTCLSWLLYRLQENRWEKYVVANQRAIQTLQKVYFDFRDGRGYIGVSEQDAITTHKEELGLHGPHYGSSLAGVITHHGSGRAKQIQVPKKVTGLFLKIIEVVASSSSSIGC